MIDPVNDTITALEVAAIDGLVIYVVVRYWIGRVQKLWQPRKKETGLEWLRRHLP